MKNSLHKFYAVVEFVEIKHKIFHLLHKLRSFFRSIKDYIDGDFAYENYLKHHQKFHQDKQVLNKKDFLKDLQNKKWNKVNRCC